MYVALFACALAVTAIRVEGAARCPTAAEVETRLGPLLPAGEAAAGAPPRVVLLDEDGGGVVLRLTEADGTVVAEKRFAPAARPGGCAGLADTAAVVVATWEARLRSGVALAVEGPLASAVLPEPPPTARPMPERWDADLFAGVYLDAGDPALAAKLGARLGRPERALALQLSLAGAGPARRDVAGGEMRWERLAVGLGPAFRLGTGPWRARLSTEATLGILLADGSGFERSRTDSGIDFGGTAGVSLGRRFGGITPWLAVELFGWLRRHELTVTGATDVIRPPRLQAWFGAGATWGTVVP